jgi:hypothetical protein
MITPTRKYASSLSAALTKRPGEPIPQPKREDLHQESVLPSVERDPRGLQQHRSEPLAVGESSHRPTLSRVVEASRVNVGLHGHHPIPEPVALLEVFLFSAGQT